MIVVRAVIGVRPTVDLDLTAVPRPPDRVVEHPAARQYIGLKDVEPPTLGPKSVIVTPILLVSNSIILNLAGIALPPDCVVTGFTIRQHQSIEDIEAPSLRPQLIVNTPVV